MALTDLQKERIIFHLDFQKGQNDILKIGFSVNLDTFSATQERLLVGTLAGALTANIVVLDQENLCTKESILGRVEQAFSKLDSDTIDNSQFVMEAGKVKLNPQEAKLRQQFYEQKVRELERALGYSEGLFSAINTNSYSGPGPRL